MPRMQFTNEVSLMDVVAIGGLLAGGAAVFFGYGADISTNSTRIVGLQKDVIRIERQSDESDKEILVQLKENRVEMKEYRQESREANHLVNAKLDRLIERELNGE